MYGITVTENLKKLDELRLKDPVQFSYALQALKAELDTHNLTATEQQYLDLLTAYDLTTRGDFKTALEILESIDFKDNNLITLRVIGLKVNIHILSYHYLEAFLSVEQLLTALPTLTNDLNYYQVIGQVILLFNNIERYDLTQQLIERGLSLSKNESLSCRLMALGLQGTYHTAGFDTYLTKFNEANTLCEQAAESVFQLLIIRNHLFYLLEQQQYHTVLQLYHQHLPKVQETRYPILSAGFNAAAAEALLHSDQLEQAVTLAAEAERILPTDRNDPAVLATYRVLYLLAKQQGDFQQLLQYADKLRQTEVAIAEEKASQQLAYQMASSEAQLQARHIALLDKDNELLSLERNLYQQQAKNRNLMLYLLISLTLMLAVLAYRGIKGSRRFRHMAEYDQLTGISNRYHFNQQARLAISYCQKKQKPLAAILFDLDYFKSINDKFGHAAGDWALQQVVQTCRHFMRNSDIFGRIGGEEFAIVLPDCVLSKAEMLAEICREALATINTEQYDHQITITASFGVSDVSQSGYDLTELLADADKALYQAKRKGRNQVYSS
ncbi:GGDEF domain-containing protein [Arsukibacterium sp.]|uniref:GGDEF domain-containing protein n=1 Tax=Arsukibacterium sp. TaxID=1977258 RepID=UPI00299EE394|nr:GGDEF domain-containing protein [Arsukibacterium sp.]MDX1677334.1 GGDEF domain-containing protein [Arsukibacterium sp.]